MKEKQQRNEIECNEYAGSKYLVIESSIVEQ